MAAPASDMATDISIHAPREGSDTAKAAGFPGRNHFYPRSPRGERLELIFCDHCSDEISIHAPREGSDNRSCQASFPQGYFYPRSPRGERPRTVMTGAMTKTISIHAPREGSDSPFMYGLVDSSIFLSTLPARGATRQRCQCAEADKFLSTLPARGATWKKQKLCRTSRFLSTLPARGATRGLLPQPPRLQISIHAPREGSDAKRPPLS